MRVTFLLILAAILHAVAFAQKPQDPELRNKRAVSVAPARRANSAERHQGSHSGELHRSQPEPTSVPKSGSSSAVDLAKVERSSVQQMKTAHKTNASSKPGVSAGAATQPQTKSKPMKFSYHPPKAAGKIPAKNPPPPPVRSGQGTH